MLSLHGLSADAWKRYSDEGYRHWEVLAAGYKYNLPDVLAALGLAQLDRLEELTESRRRLVERYDELLADVPFLTPLSRRPDVSAACHWYVVRVAAGAPLSRDQFLQALEAQGVGVGVHFRALHLHPFYRQTYGFGPGMCPVAEEAGEQVVSLPLFPGLTEGQMQRVAGACRRAMCD
jgi:dTDP-4-amino-4,6-dideoxygalactose transaminase